VLASSLAPCAATALNLVTPNELRGAGIAVFGMIGGILGGGGGPVLIAAVSEHIFKSEAAIGLGMATVLGVCCPLGALCLALGLRAMREAATEAERWDTR
jgi:MFS family permease